MTEQPDKLNNQAILLASGGDYQSAIACFKRAITLEQNNYLLWYNLGVTYKDSGDLENARLSLIKSHKMAPENEDVLETLATICLQSNLLYDAMSYSSEGLDLNPLNSHFWNLAGVVYFQEENFGMAAEFFEEAVTINPYYKDALLNLRDTYLELDNKIGASECDLKCKNL